MPGRIMMSLYLLVVGALMVRGSDLAGLYAASGMTIRASAGMPSAHVSLCGLLCRDTDPLKHEALVKQDQDRTARVTLQDDLVLNVVIDGGKWGSCVATSTKADGLKV